jgi:hypothetical protein
MRGKVVTRARNAVFAALLLAVATAAPASPALAGSQGVPPGGVTPPTSLDPNQCVWFYDVLGNVVVMRGTGHGIETTVYPRKADGPGPETKISPSCQSINP